MGVEEDLVNRVSASLFSKAENVPIKYLGLPLGANPMRLKTWQPIVDRFMKKLVLWKRRYLAMGVILRKERWK